MRFRPFKRKRREKYDFNLEESCPGLPPELTEIVRWERSSSARMDGDASAFMRTPGAHKWLHYFPIYERLFAPFRGPPISFLEIGVYKGASLNVWRNYFHPQSTVTGIDINPECAGHDDAARNVHVRIGSQDDKEFLDPVVREFGPFDVIMDDGSHCTSHMIASFNHLFSRGLKDGGLYLAGDLHTNLWPAYRNSDRSFLEFSHGLVECLHQHYRAATGERDFRVGDARTLPFVSVPRITTMLEEIQFVDSIVAISKSQRSLPQSQHW